MKNGTESDVLCIFSLFFFQSVPIGVPHVVSPNLEKLDLNRLKEDIPKYRPWISSSSATVWNTFMAKDLEGYLSTPESGDEWIMQDVFKQERPPPSESTSSREDNPELAAMFAAEHESCQIMSSTNLVHSVSQCCIYSLTTSV